MVAVLFFSMIDCPLSDDILMYDSRMNNFKVRMNDIRKKKKNHNNETPKLYRNLTIE